MFPRVGAISIGCVAGVVDAVTGPWLAEYLGGYEARTFVKALRSTSAAASGLGLAHLFDREPGQRIRAGEPARAGQQLGVLDQAARIPGRGNSTAGQGVCRRFLHRTEVHDSNLATSTTRRSPRSHDRETGGERLGGLQVQVE